MIFQINPSIDFGASLSSGKVDGFSMLEDLINTKTQLENELAEKFSKQLKNNASQVLYSTKGTYIESIDVNGGTVSLDTSKFVVDLVENGKPSFDMKPGLLNGPKVKVNKQGKKYAVVPVSKFKQGRYNWRDRNTGRFDEGTNKGGDVEFRVVSENSPPDSWIHPGHEGFHLMENTMQDFETEMDNIIDKKIEESLNNI